MQQRRCQQSDDLNLLAFDGFSIFCFSLDLSLIIVFRKKEELGLSFVTKIEK